MGGGGRGGHRETYRFDLHNKHLFFKFTTYMSLEGYLLRTCLFIHLHSQHYMKYLPPRTRAALQVTSQVTIPMEQKLAPKSGPAHSSNTFTPVKSALLENSEQCRHVRSKRIHKLLLQGAALLCGTGHNKTLTSPQLVLPKLSIGSNIKENILDVCMEHSHLLTAYHNIIYMVILPSNYTSPRCSLNKTMLDYI